MVIKLCDNSDESFQRLMVRGTTQAPAEQSWAPTSCEGLRVTWPEPHGRPLATWGSEAIGSWWDILIGLLLPHPPSHPIHCQRSDAIRWRQMMLRNAPPFGLVATHIEVILFLSHNNIFKRLHVCSALLLNTSLSTPTLASENELGEKENPWMKR